eukprot:2202292-Amphidinium_carterae.1
MKTRLERAVVADFLRVVHSTTKRMGVVRSQASKLKTAAMVAIGKFIGTTHPALARDKLPADFSDDAACTLMSWALDPDFPIDRTRLAKSDIALEVASLVHQVNLEERGFMTTGERRACQKSRPTADKVSAAAIARDHA